MERGGRRLETTVNRWRHRSEVGLLGQLEGAFAARPPRPLPPASLSKKRGIHRTNFVCAIPDVRMNALV
jgi:hypothetical protein